MTTLDSKQSTMRARQRTKRCSACTRTKPVTEFYASADYADGRWAKCKECVRKRNGAYKQRKRARLPVAAPPTESLVETAPERPQEQPEAATVVLRLPVEIVVTPCGCPKRLIDDVLWKMHNPACVALGIFSDKWPQSGNAITGHSVNLGGGKPRAAAS